MTPKPVTFEGRPSRLAALIALGLAGVSVFLTMPVIVAALTGSLGYTARDAGVFSAVQLVGISLGCLLSILAPRVEMRLAGGWALGVLLVCDLVSVGAAGRFSLLPLRLIGGIAGGVAVAQATGGLAGLKNSERDFGLFLAAQTVVAIAGVYGVPALVRSHGAGAAFVPLVLIEVLAIALVWRSCHAAPRRRRCATRPAASRRSTGSAAAACWRPSSPSTSGSARSGPISPC